VGTHFLDHFFNPGSVALLTSGGTQPAVATRVLENLLQGGFRGRISLVDPQARELAGTAAAASSLSLLQQPPDLAVLSMPSADIHAALTDCGRCGVHAVLILSGHTDQAPDAGKQLDHSTLATARAHGIRIIGPDWVGLMRPGLGLNASFSHLQPLAGHLAVVSQSGAVTSATLDWAGARRIGFSSVVSLGDTSDVDMGDVLDFLATDGVTRSILLYVESIGDARRFMSGLRAAARLKPVIVMKAGRHRESYRAAHSHTGVLVGADDAFDAALSRAGAVRVPSIGQLFASAELLAVGRRLAGDRIAVITNGGGPGIVATDLLLDAGLRLAALSTETLQALDRHLPPAWPRANPVDIQGDADARRYADSLRLCLLDQAVDGVLVILSPQALAQAGDSAEAVMSEAGRSRKPVLACWVGGGLVRAGRERFTAGAFPNYATPENAVEALAALARYRISQSQLQQIPEAPERQQEANVTAARQMLRQALDAGRRRLTPAESKAVLQAFHIAVTPTLVAHSAEEARQLALNLFRTQDKPLALKINAAGMTHKADIGGVRLNLMDAQAVAQAWREIMQAVAAARPDITPDGCSLEPMHNPRNGREVMLGVVRDPVFGPVISFGAGGSMVETIKDSVASLPPLNAFLARNQICRARVTRRLAADLRRPGPASGDSNGSMAGDRNGTLAGGSSSARAAERNAHEPLLEVLEHALLRLSDLICTLPEITDMDINPVIVDVHNNAAVAVDARLSIEDRAPDRTYSHMAIMPYPAHLARTVTLGDGTPMTLRPIKPEDARLEANFLRSLSPRSRYFRFMKQVNEISQTLLIRFTQIDYDREMAYVAIHERADGGNREQAREWAGVARYYTNPDGVSCEFALAVADAWQNRGLGRLLMSELMATAAEFGLEIMEGQVLAANRPMLALMRGLGFSHGRDRDDPQLVNVRRTLKGALASARPPTQH